MDCSPGDSHPELAGLKNRDAQGLKTGLNPTLRLGLPSESAYTVSQGLAQMSSLPHSPSVTSSALSQVPRPLSLHPTRSQSKQAKKPSMSDFF